MNAKTLFRELRRRNVHKVAIAYAVTAWLLIQTALTLLPAVEAPPWLMPAFIVLLVLGFGLIVFISWAFEATPDGLKRTENVPPDLVLPSWSRQKFAAFIATIALFATSLLVFDLVRGKPVSPPITTATETNQ